MPSARAGCGWTVRKNNDAGILPNVESSLVGIPFEQAVVIVRQAMVEGVMTEAGT
jgi:hypothetical protein